MSRELRRNVEAAGGAYRPHVAQRLAEQRRAAGMFCQRTELSQPHRTLLAKLPITEPPRVLAATTNPSGRGPVEPHTSTTGTGPDPGAGHGKASAPRYRSSVAASTAWIALASTVPSASMMNVSGNPVTPYARTTVPRRSTPFG